MSQAPTSPQSLAAAGRKEIENILEKESITVFFQPVVSVKGKNILGFEAFSRSQTPEGARMDARDLFEPPWDPELRLRLCRLCRRKALEAFRPIFQHHPQMCIFLNVDSVGLKAVERPGHLFAMSEAMEIPSKRIIVELDRQNLTAPEVLRFIAFYRERGFGLSIDASGSMSVPTEEIIALKPDYLKIDRPLYTDVEGQEFKRDMVLSVHRLAKGLGCVLTAKSVESEEEAIRLLDWGVNHQQGFYYTKDKDTEERDPIRAFQRKVEDVNRKYREGAQAEVAGKRKRFEDFHKVLKKAVYKLGEVIAADFAAACERLANAEESLLSAYVLSDEGIQLTPQAFKRTLVAEALLLGPERGRGEDLGIRDDVVHLKSGFDKYVAPTVVSPHAKVPVSAISTRFYNKENQPYILCLEFLCQ